MTQLLISEVSPERLLNLSEMIEVVDSTGRVIWLFVPQFKPTPEEMKPDISEEELTRRLTTPGKFYTTAEVLAHLEKL